MTKKLCPACSNLIKSRSKGMCPECGTELAIVYPEDGGPSHYAVVDPDDPKVRQMQQISQNGKQITSGGLKISKGNEVPLVHLVGENKYRVIYQGVIHRKPLYCPSCDKYLLDNIIVESGPNEHEIKCGRCKAMVAFIFDPKFKLDIRAI